MAGRLSDRVAVVAGGTGSVGEGLVRAFMEEGAHVVVPYRAEHKRAGLEEYVRDVEKGRLICLPGVVSDEDSMSRFWADLRQRFDRIDLAVACLGGWYYGYSLHRMPFDHWQQVMTSNLTTHFLFMRASVSTFHDQNEGMYVMINGGASQIVAPEAGVISIVAAAQRMMARVIAEEAKGTGVRSYSVVAFNPVKTRERGGNVMPDWVTGEDLGDYIGRLYAGDGVAIGQVIHTIYTVNDLPVVARKRS